MNNNVSVGYKTFDGNKKKPPKNSEHSQKIKTVRLDDEAESSEEINNSNKIKRFSLGYDTSPEDDEKKDILETNAPNVHINPSPHESQALLRPNNIRQLEMAPFFKRLSASAASSMLTAATVHGLMQYAFESRNPSIWENSGLTTAISTIEHTILRQLFPRYRYGFPTQRQVIIEVIDEMLDQYDNSVHPNPDKKFCLNVTYYISKGIIIFLLACAAHKITNIITNDDSWYNDAAVSLMVVSIYNIIIDLLIHFCNL